MAAVRSLLVAGGVEVVAGGFVEHTVEGLGVGQPLNIQYISDDALVVVAAVRSLIAAGGVEVVAVIGAEQAVERRHLSVVLGEDVAEDALLIVSAAFGLVLTGGVEMVVTIEEAVNTK